MPSVEDVLEFPWAQINTDMKVQTNNIQSTVGRLIFENYYAVFH